MGDEVEFHHPVRDLVKPPTIGMHSVKVYAGGWPSHDTGVACEGGST